MRWLALIVLAGCGRFGFDADPRADPDARFAGDANQPPPSCVGPDEDGDGWPNACDNCLTVANPTQTDVGEVAAGGAADGVGDACDPRPSAAGDRVTFAAMHDGNALAPYDASYGIVGMPGNGALRLGATNNSGSAVFLYGGALTRVECMYTVVAVSNQVQWFGVWTDENNSDAIFREAAWDVGFPSAVFRIKQSSQAPDRYSSEIVGPTRFTAGGRYHLVSDTNLVTGVDERMTVTDVGTGVATSTSLAIGIPRFGKGYLEANNAIVDFEYLVIYGVQ